MTCEHCRQQLLPFLYDLLEPAEKDQAAAHLESCPDCQHALAAAREQQGLLAEAVKEEHADIVFKAPSKANPASTAPTVLMQRPRRRFFLLNRWAAAAAILFLLFSVGSVAGWSVWREQTGALDATKNRLAKVREDLSKSQGELKNKQGQTQKEIRAIQEQIDTLFNDWRAQEDKSRKVLEEKGAHLFIKGPQAPLAGANNYYNVEVRQDQGQGANFPQLHPGGKDSGKPWKGELRNQFAGPPPQLQVRVFNQRTQDTLYQQDLKVQGVNNEANFVLPSNMPIKPNEDIAIQFQLQTADGKLITMTDNLKLVFPEYVTHLTTDRPLYRPGDTVRFRSLTLERFSLKPADQKFHLRYRIVGPNEREIYNKEFASAVVVGPNNEAIKGPNGGPLYCVGAGEFALPANLPAGQYTLQVNEVNERFNEEKRAFLVHNWQPPRFLKEVQFHRSSYAAGDQLKVQVRAVPLPIGTPCNHPVIGSVIVDGVSVWSQTAHADNEGRAAFECVLPNQIQRGDGIFILECGGAIASEKLVRTIPLVVRDLQVEFYPEGGELIAGAQNRVYFQARTPANRPAELTGRIVDDQNQEVASVQTFSDAKEPGINQGLGFFTFAPEFKKNYKLIIDSPLGIERTVPLPDAKEDGVIMTIPEGVVENDINVEVMSMHQRRRLMIGVYCRGRLMDHKEVVRAGVNQPVSVTLRPNLDVGGVYRVTVFEIIGSGPAVTFRPLAERLVYRKGSEKVNVAITKDRASYGPGDTVKLSLHAKNEKRAYVPTLAMMAVVDDSILKRADERAARSMPSHFLLTTEVRNPEDLEYADILLGDHPKAAVALDLLLGSQGWRRFAEQNPQQFQRGQQEANRLQMQQPQPNFLANTAVVTQFFDNEQKQIDKLDQTFVKNAIDMEKKLAENEMQENGPAELQQDVALKESNLQAANQEVAQVDRHLREVRAFLIQLGLGGILLLLLFIGFYLISIGLRRLSEGGGNARPWLLAGIGLLGLLFGASVIGTFALIGENLLDDFRAEDRGVPKMAGLAVGGPVQGWEAAPLLDPELVDRVLEEEPVAEELPKNKDQANEANQRAQNPMRGNQLRELEQNRPAFNRFVEPGNIQNNLMPQPNDVPEDRLLRQKGNYQALLVKNLGRRVQLPPANDPCVVRVYAHQHKPQADALHQDLTETVYWHPVLVLPDGKAEVQFALSDAVTRYQVLVQSNTFDGRLGANRIEINSTLPFRAAPITPMEVSDKDQLSIPVMLQNDRPQPGAATLTARYLNLQSVDNTERTLNLQDKILKRELFHVKPTIADGNAVVRLIRKSAGASDVVERKIKVVQDGFPVAGAASGMTENGIAEHEITLPERWIPGSLHVQAHFYPSVLAELQGGLDALAAESFGGFEQHVSKLSLHALMLQNMKQQANQVNPTIEKRARQALQIGLEKLAAFECIDPADMTSKRGFRELPGAGSPDEALTAFGLLQLRDIANVYSVDAEMLERTEQFLLDLRDGNGGFKLHKKNASADAYIVWALTENGPRNDFDKELAALREQCKTRKDPYFLTLVALGHLNCKKEPEGIDLLKEVRKFQKDNSVAGAETSITGSQGRDLDIETTSLAVLGWLRADRVWLVPQFNINLANAVTWLGQQRRGAGSIGGSPATALALKALAAYQQKYPRTLQSGEALLTARSQQPGEFQANPIGPKDLELATKHSASFSSRSQDPLKVAIQDANTLRPGKNAVQLNVTGNNSLPYTLSWAYRTEKSADDPKTPVKLSTKLNPKEGKEGGSIKLTAALRNVSKKDIGMTVAILGLPAGVSLAENAAQFKAMQAAGKIAFWELRNRELVLYWSGLNAGAKVEFELELLCRLPGVYRGPASRAYVINDSERKSWSDPLDIRIDEAR